MENKLVLLSDGLKEVLKDLYSKHKCNIAKDLLTANDYIEAYNEIIKRFKYRWEEGEDIYLATLELLDKSINNLINQEARMLSYRYNTFEISYLPKDKEPIYSSADHWSRENRVCAKPARIIQKILVNKYSCKDFENFSNWFKSAVVASGDFVIVEGEAIAKYYLEDNYYKISGSLGNSCMRYQKCQKYFDIYKDFAKMLVCLKEGKVLGRAIIWEIDGDTYMDRVYTCMDYLENQFFTYAESNKWIHRTNNELLCDGEQQEWLIPDDNYTQPHSLDLTIRLKHEYDYVPYVDSFRYYYFSDDDDLRISTVPGDEEDCMCLSTTDGNFNSDYETYTCAHCGRRVRCTDYPDDFVYSEYLDQDLCDDCAIYLSSIDDYVTDDTELVHVYINRTDYLDYPKDWCVDDPERFVEINNTWYNIDDTLDVLIEYDEENDIYKLKDE